MITFGPAYAPAFMAFNGPALTAFRDAFPDFTVNQINRLNDAAYVTNTLIKSQSSELFVGFVPQDLFLSNQQKKVFWKNPHTFFSGAQDPDLRKLQVVVSYDLVIPRDQVQPLITDVVIDGSEMDKFLTKQQVSGYILGRFLEDAELAIQNAAGLGFAIQRDTSKESNDKRLHFTITPSKIPAPNTIVLFQAVRDELPATWGETLTYHFQPPTITSIDPSDGKQGGNVTVTVQGSNLFDGHVTFDMQGLTAEATQADGVSVSATFRIDKHAKAGAQRVRVLVNGVSASGNVSFTVQPAN